MGDDGASSIITFMNVLLCGPTGYDRLCQRLRRERRKMRHYSTVQCTCMVCAQYDGQVINDDSRLASCRYRCSVFGSTVAGKGQKQEEVWDNLGRRAVHSTVLYDEDEDDHEWE